MKRGRVSVSINVLTSALFLGWGVFAFAQEAPVDEFPSLPELDVTAPSEPTADFVTARGVFPPVFRLNAHDSQSGISHFMIRLEDGRTMRVHENQLVSGDFGLMPGISLVAVQAVDNSGNESSSSFNLIIPSAQTPTITNAIPASLAVGDSFVIQGLAEAFSTVTVEIADALGDFPTIHVVDIPVTTDGTFETTIQPHLAPGSYRMALKAVSPSNQPSEFSDTQTFIVRDTVDLLGMQISPALLPVLVISGLVGLIGFIVVLFILLLGTLKKRRLKETVENELKV